MGTPLPNSGAAGPSVSSAAIFCLSHAVLARLYRRSRDRPAVTPRNNPAASAPPAPSENKPEQSPPSRKKRSGKAPGGAAAFPPLDERKAEIIRLLRSRYPGHFTEAPPPLRPTSKSVCSPRGSKEERRESKFAALAMKTTMYDNIFMHDADGSLLCTISAKKCRWYLERQLAEEYVLIGRAVGPKEKRIRLKFRSSVAEREGIPYTSTGPDEASLDCYNKSLKQNVCVRCGSPQHLVRHYIVPYAYRTLLPTRYKEHLSHDIVVLCGPCNMNVSSVWQRRMNAMEAAAKEAAGVPKHGWRICGATRKVLSSASALAKEHTKGRGALPEDVRVIHAGVVREYLMTEGDGDDATKITVEICRNLLDTVNCKIVIEGHVPGPELIVSGLLGTGKGGDRSDNKDDDDDRENIDKDVGDFVRDWRRLFLEIAAPGFMPRGWSVNSPVLVDERGKRRKEAEAAAAKLASDAKAELTIGTEG
mmetsp:Transcript_37937/g.74268  ORF Transcript_37937/g.74268 Transcript_37937/m.74268 type:complete len:476 (+) Transcript_37937:146-1573(+)